MLDMLRVILDALSDAGHTQLVIASQSTRHHPALAMLQLKLTTTVTHLRSATQVCLPVPRQR